MKWNCYGHKYQGFSCWYYFTFQSEIPVSNAILPTWPNLHIYKTSADNAIIKSKVIKQNAKAVLHIFLQLQFKYITWQVFLVSWTAVNTGTIGNYRVLINNFWHNFLYNFKYSWYSTAVLNSELWYCTFRLLNFHFSQYEINYFKDYHYTVQADIALFLLHVYRHTELCAHICLCMYVCVELTEIMFHLTYFIKASLLLFIIFSYNNRL
jgi:hypothetical protein